MAKLENVQILRFVAASAVLFSHARHEAGQLFPSAYESWDAVPGRMGVDLFFVISGFIMLHVAGQSFGAPGASKEFLLRRLRRIVPSYWLFTTMMLVSSILFASETNHHARDWLYVIASYLFIPWTRDDGSTEPVLALGWTLNYEMFFYVVFAAALMLSRRAGLICLAAALVALAGLHELIPNSWVQLHLWSDPVILEFAAGLLLAFLRQRGVRLPRLAAALVTISAVPLFLLLRSAQIQVLSFGLPATLALAGLVLHDWRPITSRVGKAAVLLGEASYAIYLSHPFTLNILQMLWRNSALPTSVWAYVAVSTTASTLVGLLFYVWFEKKIDRAIASRRLSPLRLRQTAATSPNTLRNL